MIRSDSIYYGNFETLGDMRLAYKEDPHMSRSDSAQQAEENQRPTKERPKDEHPAGGQQYTPSLPSRRAFLQSMVLAASASASITAGLVNYEGGVKIVRSVWTRAQESLGYRSYDHDLLTEVFGVLVGYIGYAGGKLKAFGGVHPDNIASGEQIANIWKLAELDKRRLLNVCGDDEIIFDEDENLVLLGGPISNDLVRKQF